MKKNKFDWGESTRIVNTAPIRFHPGQIVSICGITKINSDILSEKYNVNIGEWIYTVEYIGGSDIEIPEHYLEKIDE